MEFGAFLNPVNTSCGIQKEEVLLGRWLVVRTVDGSRYRDPLRREKTPSKTRYRELVVVGVHNA